MAPCLITTQRLHELNHIRLHLHLYSCDSACCSLFSSWANPFGNIHMSSVTNGMIITLPHKTKLSAVKFIVQGHCTGSLTESIADCDRSRMQLAAVAMQARLHTCSLSLLDRLTKVPPSTQKTAAFMASIAHTLQLAQMHRRPGVILPTQDWQYHPPGMAW